MLDRSPAIAELVARLSANQYEQHLQKLEELAQADPKAFGEFLYDWSFWGRPAQQEPMACTDPQCRCAGRWTWWVILAGRGWGKTRTGAETVNLWAKKYPGARIALVARSASDARGVMIDGESGIVATSPPWFRAHYEPSKLRITWPNGSQAAIFTAEEPDGPRGYQHHFFWADEVAAWQKPEECWNNLMFGHRLVKKPGWPDDFRLRGLVTTTPRPLPFIWSFVRDKKDESLRPPHVHITKGATYDNSSNLAPEFFTQLVSQHENTRLGEQELLGVILEDVPGALWKTTMIDPNRVDPDAIPDQTTAIVAVDPAATSASDSNTTGIIVVAAGPAPGQWESDFKPLDGDEASAESISAHIRRMNRTHAYILHDASVKGTPETWAKKAIEMYHRFDCVAIVAEANQGGEMVRHTIQSVDSTVPIRLVHATKNKQTRAEPIVALYEQRRVHHVNPRGPLKELEKQLLEWDPELSKSPDRLDALVWGVWYLIVRKRLRFAASPVIVGERENPWSTEMLGAA